MLFRSPLDEVIGQTRAVEAIDFGLNMKSPGYNIFVTGIEGTGKSTIIRDIVGRHAKALTPPVDWCMVHNFKDEYRPEVIPVPTGRAIQFSKTMRKLIDGLKKVLPKTFEHESYQDRQTEVQQKYSDLKKEIFKKLEDAAAEKSIKVNRTKSGFQTIPIVDDKPISPEEFLALSQEKQAEIEENINAVQSEIDPTVREISQANQEMNAQIDKLMEEVTLFVVKGRIDIIKDAYKDCKDIMVYLSSVQADILENVKDFLPDLQKKSSFEGLMLQPAEPSFQRYDVNVLVRQKPLEGAPVIFETNQTYHNVFGQIEKKAHMGTKIGRAHV